jgi:uncharacterized protein (DUF2141 family)
MTFREAITGGIWSCFFLRIGRSIGLFFGLFVGLFLGIAPVSADDLNTTDTGTLTVEFTGLTSDEGNVVFAMWSGPENWLVDGAIREGSVAIDNGRSRLELAGLPYGEYAISVFHDKNANEKLDTAMFRIPKEPIGTSNDAKVRFGPPKYDDARFTLDQPELTLTIPIRKLF